MHLYYYALVSTFLLHLCFFELFNDVSGCFRRFQTKAVNYSPKKAVLNPLLDLHSWYFRP